MKKMCVRFVNLKKQEKENGVFMKINKILFGLLSLAFFSFSSTTILSCGEIGSDSGSISINSNDNSSTDSSDSTISSEESSSSESVLDSEEQSSSNTLEHVHTWTDRKTIVEATCTTDGEITYTCISCEEVKVETISALGHNEVIDQAVEATCTTTGLTEGKHCDRCNETLVKQELVEALGHIFNNSQYHYDSTGHWYECDRCDERKDYEEHTPNIEAATETDDVVCLKCNYVIEEALGHIHHMKHVSKVEATCENKGNIEYYQCNGCKKYYEDENGLNEIKDSKTLVINPLGHNYGSIINKQEATCTTDGAKEHYHCDRCSKNFDSNKNELSNLVITAKGHTEVIDKEVLPTCTETGLTQGSHCDVCKEILVKQEVVPALGHDYKEVVTNPTCTEQGYSTHTCNRCNDSYVDLYVEATGHSYGEWITTLNPTCEEEGLKRRECVNCEYYEEDVVEALGHNEVIDEAVAATCTQTGLSEGSHCDRCKEILVKQEVVDALGHNEVIDEAVDPTCTETGLTEGSHCDRCKEVFVKQEVVDTLGHNFVNYLCSECGQEDYSEGLIFTSYGDSYSVTGIGTAKDTDIVIPSIYNGLPVTSIGEWAFDECSSLESVTIGNSVTSIDRGAFLGCSSLTSITIPDSVTSIGDSAFALCESLTSVTIGNSVTSIGRSAFYGCSSLTSITIPDSVTSIGNSAFYYCSSLTSIEIPDSVTSIGTEAFMGCSSLTSITIPNSVTSIGEYAFANCSSLENIVVDDNNKYYDSRNNCNAIIETATNKLLLGCQNTIIPNSVTSIGDVAFTSCSSLTSIIIPDSVTSIGNFVFYNCNSLTSIVVDSNNANYDSRNNCNAIIETSTNTLIQGCQNTIIPNSVISIGSSAFEG